MTIRTQNTNDSVRLPMDYYDQGYTQEMAEVGISQIEYWNWKLDLMDSAALDADHDEMMAAKQAPRYDVEYDHGY